MEQNTINKLLDEIMNLINENELSDGAYRFDVLRVRIALEFVKLEIQESIKGK